MNILHVKKSLAELDIQFELIILKLDCAKEYPKLITDFNLIKRELNKAYYQGNYQEKSIKNLASYYEHLDIIIGNDELKQIIKNTRYQLLFIQNEIINRHYLDDNYDPLFECITYIMYFIKVVTETNN